MAIKSLQSLDDAHLLINRSVSANYFQDAPLKGA